MVECVISCRSHLYYNLLVINNKYNRDTERTRLFVSFFYAKKASNSNPLKSVQKWSKKWFLRITN